MAASILQMASPDARGKILALTVVSPRSPARLPRARRREDLLDATAQLIVTDGVEAVSIEAVANRAGVSRPLVYKHFANRTEMLVELYRRESAVLHAELRLVVRSVSTLEDMYRALIRAAFKASNERGSLFRALRAAGAWNRELRREHRVRDNQTVQFFADQARSDFGVPETEAKAATRMVLMAIESIIAQWQSNRTPANAAMLEETYLDIVLGGFERIATRTSAGGQKGDGRWAGRG